jgi:hypothetical protein
MDGHFLLRGSTSWLAIAPHKALLHGGLRNLLAAGRPIIDNVAPELVVCVNPGQNAVRPHPHSAPSLGGNLHVHVVARRAFIHHLA